MEENFAPLKFAFPRNKPQTIFTPHFPWLVVLSHWRSMIRPACLTPGRADTNHIKFVHLPIAHETLLVKNMVCHRCVISVEDALNRLGIGYHHVLVGEIHLEDKIGEAQKKALQNELQKIGLELIDNRISALVEKIKQLTIKKARNELDGKEQQWKLSNLLSEKLAHEYSYLCNLFSTVEGRTIENYFIEQRIEKAKELLVYGQKNLSEIADELEYSSVAHLSAQFKKVTGLTPSHFRQVGNIRRKPLDAV